MSVGRQSDADARPRSESTAPSISTCESCPGKTVFIESGNTDGWIASDYTVESIR